MLRQFPPFQAFPWLEVPPTVHRSLHLGMVLWEAANAAVTLFLRSFLVTEVEDPASGGLGDFAIPVVPNH